MGLFDKIKQGLKKTTQLLNTDVRDLFKSKGRLVDDAFLEELRAILIKTDMGVAAATAIVEEIQTAYRARVVEMDDLLATGGTAAAATQLLQKIGANILEIHFLIELSFLNGREKLQGIPVKSLVVY